MIKKYLPKFIINLLYKFLHVFRTIYLKGDNFICPICNFQASRFLSYGDDNEAVIKFKIIGMGFRKNAICPMCQSKDRERLIFLFLKKLLKKKLIKYSSNIIHFSPERSIEKNFFRKKFVNYITADILAGKVDFILDLQDFKFKKKNFDLVICNHVLEHIENDLLAMKNIFSIMKSGGIAILQVPFSSNIDKDYKTDAVKSDLDRLNYYGQTDHVRVYSESNYLKKLKDTGFNVQSDDMLQQKQNIPSYGLNSSEKIIFVIK